MENSLMKVLMLSISVLTVTAEKHCANFVFPTAQNDGVLTVKQDENLTLPFSLQTNGCDAVGPFKITVSKKDRDTNVFVDFCDVGVHDNGSCVTGLHNGCSCLEGQGKYQISKTVDRSDETVWVWLTSNGIAAETYLNFSVLSPPSVTSLTLTTSSQDSVPGPFSLYSPVDVICKWRDGHPPTQAFLLDRHSNPLEPVTYADNRVQYSYPSVHCLDAGLIRCVAPRANHNETATLLVRCPPEFDKESVNEVSVAPNNTNSAADVKFKVRTHTKTITKCKLTSFAMRGKKSKMASNPETKDSSQNAKDCKSSSTLTGTPPDLTLTVRLDNVRKEEEGQWRLELTNDVGTGYVDFPLKVEGDANGEHIPSKTKELERDDTIASSDDDVSEPTLVTDTEESDDQTTSTAVAVVPVVLVVIIVVVVVVVLIFWRRGKRLRHGQGSAQYRRHPHPVPRGELPPVPRLFMMDAEGAAGRDSTVSGGAHLYQDIDEIKLDEGAGPDGYLQPVIPRSRKGDNRPGSYEHPAMPDYESTSTAYEQLRHVYDGFGQWRRRISKILSRD